MSFFQIGDVRVAEDADMQYFITMCDNHDGWTVDYSKGDTCVWSKLTPDTSFKIIKLRSIIKVEASVMYDVLHDPDYRKIWDKGMIKCKDICMLNPNNDIGYYALRSPTPFKNRDFVTQRSWLQTKSEYIIINHSVFHKEMPPQKNFIRGLSHITGYLIRPIPTQKDSCEMTYVAQCDPRGKLPVWAVNKATQFVAPKVLSRLGKAAIKYPVWKKRNKPDWKPWIFPEQLTLPRLNPDDIQSNDLDQQVVLDETNIVETSATLAGFDGAGGTGDDSPVMGRDDLKIKRDESPCSVNNTSNGQ